MNPKEAVENIVDNIKDILKIGNNSIICIDIGLSSVKVAELKPTGDNFKLLNYASADLPEGSIIEDDIQKPEEITEAINSQGIEIEKGAIRLPEGTLKELGEYQLDIELHPEVIQKISVSVTAEE